MDKYVEFIQSVYRLTGLDLALYKEKQMKRRISSLVSRNNFKDFDDYFEGIRTDKKLYDEFINYLTINVSEFYRNPGQWAVLKNTIVPALIKKYGKLNVWSSAGSTGEEPYSLVMLLSDFFPMKDINVLATDIDDGAISKASQGIYGEKSLANLPKEFINKFFTKTPTGMYAISNEVKARVKYQKFNLLKDNYPKNQHLILCRNVMIYFTEEAKAEMYVKFHDSLTTEGVFFVGSTEQIILPNRYRLKPIETFFYKRLEE